MLRSSEIKPLFVDLSLSDKSFSFLYSCCVFIYVLRLTFSFFFFEFFFFRKIFFSKIYANSPLSYYCVVLLTHRFCGDFGYEVPFQSMHFEKKIQLFFFKLCHDKVSLNNYNF